MPEIDYQLDRAVAVISLPTAAEPTSCLKWLSATEVEGCLLLHPAVSQVAVVGVANANGLVKPYAYVIPRERRDGLAEELKAFVRDRLEPYKHPREVIFVDSFPTTHLGKVDRANSERNPGANQ